LPVDRQQQSLLVFFVFCACNRRKVEIVRVKPDVPRF
jgi:hypothetical protein